MKVKKYEAELKIILERSILKRNELIVNYRYDFASHIVSYDFCVN